MSDIDSDDLREECRSRGIEDSPGVDVISVSDLAHAIASGPTDRAFQELEAMFADSKKLRHAIGVGRRRVR
ncbi:hypothetical protein [Sphingopyxis sp. QXT-31]|uniref:hypothetical protein n=1 Tax=Sphingopyxis sp. QXT-31 TaxID=1357916 RepID=UPI0012EB9947|nr:hypothetical protein [Sphingopyxis sp. QXT-31]